MNARHQDHRADWMREPARPLTERNDEPSRPSSRSLHIARQQRRRNQYTPIVERGWFLILIGAASIGLLIAASQGWLP